MSISIGARAPPPLRFAPAFVFAATPVVAWLGNRFKLTVLDIGYWDPETTAAIAATTLMIAAFAAAFAHRFTRATALVLSAAAISGAWIAFLMPGSSGGGAALIGMGAYLIWLISLVAILAEATPWLRWLRWIALSLLIAAAVPCLLYLAHELVFVFGPMMV